MTAVKSSAKHPHRQEEHGGAGQRPGAAMVNHWGWIDPRFTTLDIKALGPSAVREIGTFRLKTKEPTPQELAGKYLVVWEKVGNDWKLAADIWNDGK
jgi:ketosteroid isomerase-like protein